MIKNLVDNRTGLSYDIIDKCDDREQLLQWKLDCLESLSEIKSTIEQYEFNYDPEAGHTRFDWYMRAKTMRKIKSRMTHYIDLRLTKVNDIIKQRNIERSKQERVEYINQTK